MLEKGLLVVMERPGEGHRLTHDLPACIYLSFNHIVSYLLYNVIGIPCGIFLGEGRNCLKLTRYKYIYIYMCVYVVVVVMV